MQCIRLLSRLSDIGVFLRAESVFSRLASHPRVPRRTLAHRIARLRSALHPRVLRRTLVQRNVTSRFADVFSFQLLYCGVPAIFH